MPDAATLIAFSAAAVVLFVVPGPAVLYIVGRSISGGRTAGLVSVAGIHTGSLVHIAAAIAGLSALLARSAVALAVLRYAGAAYLIYLGIRALTDRHTDEPDEAGEPVSLRRVFTDGFVVNLLNPKTAAFFLAFVPQFVDPAKGTTTQLLVLGALFVVLGIVSDGVYASAAGAVGGTLQRHPAWRTGRRWVSGGIYLALGVAAALAGGNTTTESGRSFAR
jgi:threonine/homoserine/homoserine lactone efflux protein